jgi:chromosome segregation ATPase
VSEPSADADDVEPVPAQEQDLDQQLQPQGQAVGEAGGSPPTEDAVPTEQPEEAVEAPTGDAGSGATGTDSGSTGSDSSDDDSIAEELARLEADAETARAEKAEADAALADLENRLATLRAVQKDAATATSAYTAAYERLGREDQAFEEYHQFQEEGLRRQLGEDGVAEVEELVQARKDRADELDQAADDAATTLRDAEAERDRLKDEVKELADALAGWKKLTATVTAQHAELTTRREEITKARQAGEYALAYWLLGRARARRESFDDGPRLIDPDDLEDELLGAVEALADAQKDLADAERAATTAKADLAAATKARDKHRAESEAQLRESLRTAGTHATTGESNA